MSETIKEILRETDSCGKVMWPMILADIDQNLFRSAIRDLRNDKPVVYYLFFNMESGEELVGMIHERYEGFGATVTEDRKPKIDAPDYEINSAAWKFQHWYDSWDGTPIKLAAILKGAELSKNDFNNQKKRDSFIASEIKTAAEAGKKLKGKNGWYAKPASSNSEE